jgi:glycine/D-amino acid oxidase-like deaminating enzyme
VALIVPAKRGIASTSPESDASGCLYSSTATPSVPAPVLRAEVRTEVAVVGAGYTGLSTALHLAERGVATVLLEAHEPGWGAAGRNGGQVNAGLKHEPDEVERDLGAVHGPRLVRLAGEAPAYLFKLIDRLQIDCEVRREGTVRAAYRPRDLAVLQDSVAQWGSRGVQLDLWNESRVAAATGTHRYLAATFDSRGGSVNPLSLARGLAAAAIAAGTVIFGHSRACRLERAQSGWCVITTAGRVRADKLVLATDGYTDDLWPGLRSSIVPIYSTITASAPLPAPIAASVLPAGGVVYESGDLTIYYRRDQANRLLMGGRGRQRPMNGRADARHLVRYAERLWPALAGVEWTHRWNGQFALTPDFYPRFHAPAHNVYIALGYSGRGVALATAVGAELAAAATGSPVEALALPVTDIVRIPFHSLWKIGVGARVAYSRLRNRLGA